ncbi:MAG: acetyl-CoA carboxylase, carboxyltransferase subunit beta [Phycisphaerales bacterium JB043]
MSDKAATAPQAPRTWADVQPVTRRTEIPEGLWLRCPQCEKMIYRKQMEANAHVCPDCDHHFRINATQRVEQLVDPGSFEPLFEDLHAGNPLKFKDLKPYPDRVKAAERASKQSESVKAGTAFIKGRPVTLACLDLAYMLGSLGSAAGEILTRSIELATERDLPLVIVSCSGGARMQESGLSLMQMAKTSAALARFDDAGGLFISVLTDPTTGGVTASFAMLGDVILAEPKALIGFAGPRVIAQTIRQELPESFQRSEFLQESGMVDRVVRRDDLRSEIARIIDYAGK